MTAPAGCERPPAVLSIASGRCAAVADRISEDLIQELSGLCLSLGAAAEAVDLTDEDREELCARARVIQQCSRLLGAVAERLAGLDGRSEATAG